MNYLTDDYHNDLALRYEARKLKLDTAELAAIIAELGFGINSADIKKATGGNVSGTYLTPDYAIKIQNDKNRHEFLANEMVSEKFLGKLPVVEVLAYNRFEKTEYEVLVMRLGAGELLLPDFPNLGVNLQKILFSQVLEIVAATSELVCSDFGEIRLGQSFNTFTAYLKHEFQKYGQIITEEKLCTPEDVEKLSQYFYNHISVFDDEKFSFFNHTDVHMGNVLYEGDKVTLLFDFDGAIKGPKYLSLLKIIGAIDEPSQFVEGTPCFELYENRKFDHLYPILKEKMSDALATPNLVRKLNLLGIVEGIKWISENWSAEWNKSQMHTLLTNEVCDSEASLDRSYYGVINKKIAV